MMDETLGISNALPPFIAKTYEMVDDPASNSIVTWSSSDRSFVVWNPPEFARVLLPKFFKHSNFSSFIRQLNTYGFRKTDPEQWEFANDDFVRGQPHRLKNIHRRKPVHSRSVHNQVHEISYPLTESERQGYNDDIERLKHEKETLQLELEKKTREREKSELHAQCLLKQQLECISQRQEKLLALLAQVLKKPGLGLSLSPIVTSRNRKRRLLTTDCFKDEAEIEGNQPKTCQVSGTTKAVSSTVSTLNTDPVDQMESSIAFLEDILYQVSRTCGQGMYDIQTPLAAIVTDIDPLLEEAVINPDKCNSLSMDSGDNSSTLRLDESRGCADSPAFSFLQLNIDVPSKGTCIDISHESSIQVPKVVKPTDKASEAVRIIPTGANDTFWEQFLTEHPGSSDLQEAHVEKKDPETRKQSDPSKFWWNIPFANNLVEQMGAE